MCSPPAVPEKVDGEERSPTFGEENIHLSENRAKLQYATRLGAASIGFLLLATTVTFPYLQSRRDELGCDTVCTGSMTSTRSALTLIGATLVGRISDMGGGGGRGKGDSNARRFCLFLGVAASGASVVFAKRAQNLTEFWISVFPSMLQQNTSVMNALITDYHSMYEDGSSDRASSAGTLGMVAGLALMVGPLVGSRLLSGYDQAVSLSLVLLVVSACFVVFLPFVDKSKQLDKETKASPDKLRKPSSFLSFLDVPSARSPAAIFILAFRLLNSLAFHIYGVIGPVSLRRRFNFGPKEYGVFFFMIGLFFALSQGFAGSVVRKLGGDTSKGRSRLLVVCIVALALCRYMAFHSLNLTVVYSFYAVIFTAIGTTGTIISADSSHIAAPGEVGSFFGIATAVESGAGMVGPLIASALASSFHPTMAPLYMSVLLNIFAALLSAFAYEKCVYRQIEQRKKSATHEKQE